MIWPEIRSFCSASFIHKRVSEDISFQTLNSKLWKIYLKRMKPLIVLCLWLSVFLIQIVALPQTNSRIKNSDGSWKPIYEVVKTGNVNDIRELLANNINIDEPGENSNSALILAAGRGQKEIVEMLMKKGANVNYRNDNHWTPLSLAAYNGRNEVIEFMIEKGVNVDQKNKYGSTPLIYAAWNGQADTANLLIRKGAKIDHVNDYGETPLIWAAHNGHKEIADSLIQKGANVNQENVYSKTPLTLASEKGFKEIADLLIRKGANVNYVNKDKWTALIWATDSGHADIVDLLIAKGANINHTNSDGDTALHIAANAGREEISQSLVRSGASVLIKNKKGKTPKDLATEKGFTNIIYTLREKGSTAKKACDLYSNLLSDRIFGGDFAEEREFPWMAALGYLSQSYKIYFGCGGTVISDLFVLTAAHCVLDKRRPVVVRMGKLSLTDSDGTIPDNYQIRDIIRHPNYSITEKTNDIALIRVLNRIWFSDFVRPACLQIDISDVDTDINLTVTGWGKISNELHNISNTLRKTDLKTMPMSQCNTTFLEYNKGASQKAFRNGLGEGQYCAHDPINRSDSCEGDSGGPLQIIHPNVTLSKIVGVVSFGISCGTALPSIYTRVAYYLEWIETYVWPNGEVSTPLVGSDNE